jgi:hypothetical protein
MPEGAEDTLDEALREAEENCSVYLLRELLDPVQKIAEKLAEPHSSVTPAMLRNMDELCERVRRLNFSRDRAVATMADDLQVAVRRMRNSIYGGWDPCGYAREEGRNELKEITKKFAGFM